MCQLSATGIAFCCVEGEVGHEVVGYDIADELAGDTVEVGNEEVGLRHLLVVHRIVGVTDVLCTVHDGAELALGDARDIEHDVLHAFR